MRIAVLGTGCPKCRQAKENVRAALAETGRQAEVAEIKDLKAIADYGVMLTPAVVVDGEVKISGRVPPVELIKSWLG